ncbi:hypothetical protein N665_0069s0028 [Sinapis alba]|nr:hypothetical protein N665_0069s0028 [Sinapis alba]
MQQQGHGSHFMREFIFLFPDATSKQSNKTTKSTLTFVRVIANPSLIVSFDGSAVPRLSTGEIFSNPPLRLGRLHMSNSAIKVFSPSSSLGEDPNVTTTAHTYGSSPLLASVMSSDVPKLPVFNNGSSLNLSTPSTSQAGPVVQLSSEVVLMSTHSSSVAITGSGNHTHSLGAWAKPLTCLGEPRIQSVTPLESTNWPDLSSKTMGRKKHHKEIAGTSTFPEDATRNTNSTFPTDKSRFPWTARMNPISRNLHRVTMPEYMEDGTPKVTIPNHVLLHGLQNQKEYVIGQFLHCLVPSGGLVHAILNRLWGRKCKIFVKKISDFSYILHIPDENTRKWVLERGMWHVDDCIMVVAPWTNSGTLSLPEISTIPAWVTLKNIPSQLYSIPAIEWIASGLGEPMLSHKPWLDPTMIGEAKIMVEVELDKPFPQKIAAWDKQGNYSMVDVEYSWLPSKCEKCGQLGHKAKRCLSLQKTTALVHEKRVYVDTEQEQAPSTSYQTNGYREPVATTSGTISTSDEIAISATETTAVDGITPASHSSPAIDTTNNSTKAVQTFSILPPASGTVSPPTSLDGKESNKIDRVTTSIADGLMALADITELENISQNPGVVTIANSVFGSNPAIDPNVLARAFQLDPKVIMDLQAKF